MERLILDTGVLIAIERRKVSLDDALADDDDPAIAAITAAELLQGVELADDTNRLARQTFVDTVLATIPVEEYTVDVARAHARLLAHVRKVGQPRGAHDLIIAATALTTARTVVTHDKRARFDDLPGVRVRHL
ncbi:PIN domain-containing protein [Streptomyces sp. NPDC096153]|uniref:PIN domain-containing protein n=1 Tax=Streptomyces sp. NPDC096153 TaxID=3155548 RepID=UPI00332BE878